MTKAKNCDVCRHSGLALFFLRWGAIAKEGLIAPSDASSISTDVALVSAMALPALKHSNYVLRLLRPGYLHIYHEKAPKWLAAAKKNSKDPEAKHWEVLRVTPSGALIPESHPSFKLTEDFQCKTDSTHIFTALSYRLPDAHNSGKIWAAFSANLWNSTTRKQNKMNADVMDEIDIPSILGGKKPKNAASPDGTWIDKHVAEFAVRDLSHARLAPTLPFKPHQHEGAIMAKRMAQLDGIDEKTKGKSLVYVLQDAVGTATDLADISRARYQKGVDYAEQNRQPAGTAARIKGLEAQARRIEEAQLAQKPGRGPRMTQVLRTDQQGRTTTPDGRALDIRYGRDGTGKQTGLPLPDNRQHWEFIGELSADSFIQMQRTGELPKSAILYPYADSMMISGPVFAPVVDMDEKRLSDRTAMAMAKMNRLHKPGDVTKFIANFDDGLEKHQKAVDEYDSDRKPWLAHDALRRCFLKHYDPTDNTEKPCIVYMEEAGNALISWGGVSAPLEDLMSKLLDAKPEGMDGWALRAMVGNQKGIYSQMTNLFAHMGDWTTSEDAKLDKTYDSLKFALFEEEGGKLVAKYAWLKGPGIGLSFGIMGFMGGAATQLLGTAMAKEAPSFAKNLGEQMAMMNKFVDGKTGNIKNKVVAAELNRSMKIQAWCHQQALLLEGHLNKKPPARPVYARVTLTIDQAVEMLVDFKQQGDRFNKSTRKALEKWKKMPESVRGKTVQLDFLTTDHAIRNAGNIEGVADAADHVRIALNNHSGATIMSLTTAQLGELYREAHRYDGIKKALVDLLGKTAPQVGDTLNRIATLPAKATIGAARGMMTWQGQFSFWGAVLQWRGLMKNWTKLDNLQIELEKIPNLTDEQKAAINDEMTLTKLGMVDNVAGIAGGLADLSAVGAGALKLAGTASLMRAVAAFGGSAGSFANAAQNYQKAVGKARDGDMQFSGAYIIVFVAYGIAGFALFFNGIAIIAEWLVKRLALRVGMSIAAMIGFGVTRLSWVGWVATIVAFLIEGVVNWFDRTKMEAWVENSYFGDKNYRDWQAEEAAYDEAMKDMQEQALRQGGDDLPQGAH